MRLLSPVRVRPAISSGTAQGLARAAQAALLALAATLYVLVMVQAAGRHQDLDTYLQAGRDLLAGRSLYAPFLTHPFPDPTLRPAFIYPPAFALLLAPLSLVPAGAAPVLWLGAMQAAIAGALALSWRALRPQPWAVVLMIAATLTFYPLWVDAIQGQANGMILLLSVAGIFLVVRGRSTGGLAIGGAAALKLTPAFLLLWLLVERRWRAAMFCLAGFALATGLGALIRPADSLSFFTRVLPQLAKGTAYYSNQSVSGFLNRMFTANPYTNPIAPLALEPALAIACAILLLGFWLVRRTSFDPWGAAVSFLPLLPLLSSVTWEHHLVIVLPVVWTALALLARAGWPAGKTIVVAALFCGFTLVPHWSPGPTFGQPGFRAAQTGDPLVLVAANGLLLTTLILLLCTPWLLRAR
jgi:alpha-1,2-mannosyltransferase